MATPYDVIIIGTGAGGGTLARHLAPSGKRILLLERGDWLPRELENWDGEAVFVQNRYISPNTWYDKEAKAFQPQVHYCVGGATKLYGAALYRQRKEDFGELRHHDGISPAWPISYDEMEPYYTKAEQLYQVHGRSEEHTSELQSQSNLVCRLLLEKKKQAQLTTTNVDPHIREVICWARGVGRVGIRREDITGDVVAGAHGHQRRGIGLHKRSELRV